MEGLFQLYLIQSIFYVYVCSQVTRLFNYMLRRSGWTESVFLEKDLLLFILLFIVHFVEKVLRDDAMNQKF